MHALVFIIPYVFVCNTVNRAISNKNNEILKKLHQLEQRGNTGSVCLYNVLIANVSC